MVRSKKNTPAEDLIESLMNDIGQSEMPPAEESKKRDETDLLSLANKPYAEKTESLFLLDDLTANTENDYGDDQPVPTHDEVPLSLFDNGHPDLVIPINSNLTAPSEATVAIESPVSSAFMNSDSEKTVAVAGFQIKSEPNYEDKVKVSVGQSRPTAYSPGYAAWGSNPDSNLAQADNLRMAQDKILDLERENEQLRQQNEELISASEIIKERSDLLTAQVSEFKRDRDGLEESFKNEMTLLKNHLTRKDAELQRAQFKVDELESRLKFDMKKIRIRERELENRLELIRAEKNAIVKNKDEQILDLRRKMDIVQMEVDSYRQKCVELNKLVEINQDSFKRTTRALRLAMANLELQEENKVSLKKVD